MKTTAASAVSRGKRRIAHDVRGTTLFEMIAYVAILAMIVNLSARTLIDNTRMSAIGAGGIAAFDAMQDIREDFTQTVQAAAGVCSGIGEYRSGDAQLVLQMPAGREETIVGRYAVFGTANDPPTLFRIIIVQQANRELQVESANRYPRDLASVSFAYAGRAPGAPEDLSSARLVTMNVTPSAPQRGNAAPRPHRFAAAMRVAAPEGTP